MALLQEALDVFNYTTQKTVVLSRGDKLAAKILELMPWPKVERIQLSHQPLTHRCLTHIPQRGCFGTMTTRLMSASRILVNFDIPGAVSSNQFVWPSSFWALPTMNSSKLMEYQPDQLCNFRWNVISWARKG